MEEIENSFPELTISKMSDRTPTTVEDGTYEAKLTGYKIIDVKTKWGPGKAVLFKFSIIGSSYDGCTVYHKAFMAKSDSGEFFIGRTSKLAEAIKTLSGTDTLTKSAIGTPVMIKVKNAKGKNDVVYSNVDTIIPLPKSRPQDPKPMQTPQDSKPMQTPQQGQKLKHTATANALNLDDLESI